MRTERVERLRVSCARVRTEELKARASARYHGRSWWPKLLFAKGGDYNVWDGAGKIGEGAEHHRGFAGDDGLAGEAEEMAEALVVGDVRVHDEDEEGEEDIEEEADPGSRQFLRSRGRSRGCMCHSSRKKTTASSLIAPE